jgi:hypothetical protein
VKNIVIGVFTAVITGLLSYSYTFITKEYPKTTDRISRLEIQSTEGEKRHNEIKGELSTLREGQREIYKILIEKK